MQREYLILMREDKSCGAVKIEQVPEGLMAEIDVEKTVILENNGVFKAYLSMPEKGEVRYLGVLDDHKGNFFLKDTRAPLGIVITIKNTNTAEETLCCVCAEEGKIKEIRNCFEGREKREILPKQTTGTKLEKEYIKTAETQLFELFPECEFEKVNGYFLRNNSKVAEFIMSGKEVYRRITKWGYYYYAHKGNGEFVIAIPSMQGDETPFEGCGEYSFYVGANLLSDTGFYCIVAGSDENGDYFCRKK